MDVPSYDPLWDNKAFLQYAYVSHSFFNRDAFMPSSKPSEKYVNADLARIVCDFPYMKMEEAKALKFDQQINDRV